MMRALLIRGMLIGVLAGLLSFATAKILGEPQVDRAIGFEEQMDAAKSYADKQQSQGSMGNMNMKPGETMVMSNSEAAEPVLVSRATQSGIGLLTAIVAYSAAFGGLFALVFGFIYGRVSPFGARATAALMAAAAFTTIYFVGAEEGATSLISGMYVHEFVHDGRHLLGFPCH